ncbi:FtsX-like permease family protein [Exiguobacterium sp. s57]|uniref:FtsX-like permease family protein n=1 Tax=Exiguobacterium sp. s57 TaxID=2751258 RepID=UPI001BE59091|nr:FtsX-like permease family protein [Exiguobacterium sp. s57]
MKDFKNLLKISYGLYRRSPMIAFTSIASVVISISLVITMVLFTLNSKEAVMNDIKQIYGDMDISVGYESGSNKVIDKEYIERLQNDSKVEDISPVLIFNLPLETSKSNADVYSIGVKNDPLSKSRYHFTKDLREKQVIVNEGLARALGVEEGERLSIQGEDYIVLEVLKDATSTGVVTDTVILSYDDLKEHMARESRAAEATYILIKTKTGTDNLKFANYLTNMTSDTRVEIAESEELLSGGFQSMNNYIMIISALILIVSAFILISNFDVFIRKYRYQLSIMRTIGASTKQLFTIFSIQSGAIILVGTILSIALSALMNTYFQDTLMTLLSIESYEANYSLLNAILVGFLSGSVIQAIMGISAYRNSKVLPLNVMKKNYEVDFKERRFNKIVLRILWIVSISCMVVSVVLVEEQTKKIPLVLLAIVFFLIALYMGLPTYLTKILNVTGPFLRKVMGNVVYVAIKNIIPQVKKNTFLILIVNILMVVVVLGSTMLNTIKQNQYQYINDQYPTEILLKSRIIEGTELDPYELIDRVERRLSNEKINFTSTVNSAEVFTSDNHSESVDYVTTDLKRMNIFGVELDESSDYKQAVVISEQFSKKYNVSKGDSIDMGKYSVEAQEVLFDKPYQVIGVADITNGDMYFDNKNEIYAEQVNFNKLFIDEKDSEMTTQVLKELISDYPTLQVNTLSASLDEANKQFVQRWFVFVIAIIVMVLSVLMGLCNSLINYISTKRKEYGILRAISLTSKELGKLIMVQIMLFVISGIMLGIVSGITVSLILSIIDPGKIQVDFLLIGAVSVFLISVVLIIFVPFSKKISTKNLKTELVSNEN